MSTTTKHVISAITILLYHDRYLFIRRSKAPYEGLLSMVGGKVKVGEHIRDAAIREVMEETGAASVQGYRLCGFVSERLVNLDGELESHFHIFLGSARIDDFKPNHREGKLGLFTADDLVQHKKEFIPSDWHMFTSFISNPDYIGMYEAEIIRDGTVYTLAYYREVTH